MDENTIFDKVHDIDLKKTMENSYIDYAMSVIASRALPDVRDGLKPVQRRILYAMIELNNGPDKPHRKCARIVGDTMGKYHPHGDSSIYGALVNMAQEWSTRYPLVDGHGNFGSVDGDGAAAMRYTEARLSKISMELLADINKNTVDFRPNFDETEKEPAVLPSRFPNLLVNGTQGIAVGMATNIPPHNLREVINAVIKIIDNQVEEDRETTIEELLEIIKGPDFPTGATILGRSGIDQAYRTGRGKIKVRAVTDIEAMANGKQRIIVTELPYMVNKARLIEKIAALVREKKVEGITELRDESDRSGMRICIELRRDANANVILNQLYKHTQLQDTFGVIMLALVDGQPKTMNLHEMLDYYLTHQKDVVTRRTRYELNKAEERAHILEGLLIAQDNIDEVIKIIRGAENIQAAKLELMERFGLSDAQAQAIVDMRLRALNGLERAKLEKEYKELMERIGELKAILADEKKLLGVIKDEIALIRDKYGDERRTQIGFDVDDISMEDLTHQKDVVTRRTRYELNKAEERAHILEGLLIAQDNIDEVIKIIRGAENIQAAKLELMERFGLSDAQAQAIVDMRLRALNGLERAKLEKEYKELMERIGELKAILADEKKLLGVIKDEIALIRDKYGDERRTQIGFDVDDISMEDLIPRENTVITMTKLGYIKRMTVDNFKSQNRGGKGIKGMQTIDEDYIEELFMTTTHHYIMFFTNTGRVYRLKAYEIPESGRTARGSAIVNLLQLQPGEKITAVIPLVDYEEGKYLLMATKYGVVKKSSIMEYANIRKTGLAAITLKDDDQLIEVKYTEDDEDVFLVTKNGQCIRFHESDVRCIGRTSMGVRGINLTGDDEVIGMQLDSQGEALLIVSANGMGKRTLTSEFTTQHRGGKGIKCYKITEKTGDVVGVKAVNDDNEIMMITTEGIIIRTAVDSISILGRNTSGVKVMNVGENVEVASIAKVREEKLEDEMEKNTTEE